MKPDLTFLIARIVGPLLLAIGVALITQPQAILEGAADFLATEGLRILGSIVGMGLGLVLVVLHTRFDGLTATLVSLVGWVTLARGALHLLAPGPMREVLLFAVGNPGVVPVAGCAVALIGVWLAYAGYISGAVRAERSEQNETGRGGFRPID